MSLVPLQLTRQDALGWKQSFPPESEEHTAIALAVLSPGRGVRELPSGQKFTVMDRRLKGGAVPIALIHLMASTLISILNKSSSENNHALGLFIQGACGILGLAQQMSMGPDALQLQMLEAIQQLSQVIQHQFDLAKLHECQVGFNVAMLSVTAAGNYFADNKLEQTRRELDKAREKLDTAYERLGVCFSAKMYPAWQVLANVALLRLHIYKVIVQDLQDTAHAAVIPKTLNETISWLEQARREWKEARSFKEWCSFDQNGEDYQRCCTVNREYYTNLAPRLMFQFTQGIKPQTLAIKMEDERYSRCEVRYSCGDRAVLSFYTDIFTRMRGTPSWSSDVKQCLGRFNVWGRVVCNSQELRDCLKEFGARFKFVGGEVGESPMMEGEVDYVHFNQTYRTQAEAAHVACLELDETLKQFYALKELFTPKS